MTSDPDINSQAQALIRAGLALQVAALEWCDDQVSAHIPLGAMNVALSDAAHAINEIRRHERRLRSLTGRPQL
jgi:hypothetical protein